MRPRIIEKDLMAIFETIPIISLKELVSKTGYSYSGIARAVKRMESEGNITVTRNSGDMNYYRNIKE